jgi:hypothetical protein
MRKKIIIFSLILILLISLIIGCAPKPTGKDISEKKGEIQSSEELETPTPSEEATPTTEKTGSESVDTVGTEISDVSTTDEELDITDLDSLENGLNDIENI